MDIENFNWDIETQSVKWSFDGKIVRERFENAFFASQNIKNNYVIVEAGRNYSQDQIYYLSFDGKLIFKIDKENDKVSWQLQDKLVEVNCKDISNAQLYTEHSIVIVISVDDQNNKLLKGFGLDGTLLFSKQPPQGFTFNYLSTIKNQPSVVCEGDSANTDAYGRSSWHFIINDRTGEMSKGNLAY